MGILSLCATASAGTRLSIDRDTRTLHIQVDPDGPVTIDLHSDDLLPIRWERGTTREAYLPAIAVRPVSELAIVDDQSVAYALPTSVQLPQVVIDPRLYAHDANWHGQPDRDQRLRSVLLGVLFSLGLLLTLLVRRRVLVWVTLYCGAWAAALLIELSQTETLVWKAIHPEVPVRCYYAREPQTLRFSDPAAYWIPIVESSQHLQALDLRLEVREDAPELLIDLPKNGKLFMTTVRHADDSQERAD